MHHQIHDIMTLSNNIGHPYFLKGMVQSPVSHIKEKLCVLGKCYIPNQILRSKCSRCSCRQWFRTSLVQNMNRNISYRLEAYVDVLEFKALYFPHVHWDFFLYWACRQNLRRSEIHTNELSRNTTVETSRAPKGGYIAKLRFTFCPISISTALQCDWKNVCWNFEGLPDTCWKQVPRAIRYVCMDHDQENLALKENSECNRYDEIRRLYYLRYVSSPEALWNLHRFFIVHRSTEFIQLNVNLENHYTSYLVERQKANVVTWMKAEYNYTKSFNTNGKTPNGTLLQYVDFPTL